MNRIIINTNPNENIVCLLENILPFNDRTVTETSLGTFNTIITTQNTLSPLSTINFEANQNSSAVSFDLINISTTQINTTEILGQQFVTSLKYKDNSLAGEENGRELKVDGIFIHIGMVPNSGIVPTEVEKNQFGEIKVNANCETRSTSSGQAIPGLYAAGDVTDVPFKQIVIAAGQGCIATLSAVQYLNKLQK